MNNWNSKFMKLREEISTKILDKSGKEWVGKPEFRNTEDVKTEIDDILRFIRENSLIGVFREENNLEGGPLTNLLYFAEQKFGSDEMEKLLNVYETKNPLLKMLKRPNLKGITLAKFLKEIEIWERDGQGNPMKDSDGEQKKRNLAGEVKIRVKKTEKKVFEISRNSPGQMKMHVSNKQIELENGPWKAILSSTQENEDKIMKVDAGIIESIKEMLEKLGKTEVSVDMEEIVGIGGQATIIGKEIELEGENGKEKFKVCFKFEEYGKEDREKKEKEEDVKVDGQLMETGGVYGKGWMCHLRESQEFRCGLIVPEHPNVIKMLDFGITKTIFGDYFFSLGLSKNKNKTMNF